MESTERSGVFWTTFGTVTSESEVDKRQPAEQHLQLRQRKTRGKTSAAKTTTTNPPQAKKSERKRGRIFSIWTDGNLRLLHIGLCATEVLCNSRARLLASLSRSWVLSLLLPSLLLLHFFFSLFRISSCSHFDVWMCICMRERPSLSFSLHFLFLIPPLPSLSLYDETNESIFNPVNHQQGIMHKPLLILFLYFFEPLLFIFCSSSRLAKQIIEKPSFSSH